MALLSSSDWSSLPLNLLDSILDYLVPMEGYLTFSEVCIKWQYAVREKRSNHKRHCRLHQQVPLLMAPTPTPDDTRGRRCLYDVMKRKILGEVQLGQGRWRCEGSSYGWSILVDVYDCCKVILVNLFSGEQIHLPPLEKPKFLILSAKPRRGKRRRVVLSIDPDVKRDEVVLMITCTLVLEEAETLNIIETIAFIKSGQEDWTYIKELRDVEDIAYSNGLFYVLDERGALFSCDVSNGFKVRSITSADNPFALVSPLVEPKESLDRGYASYLVESPEGHLLRVVQPKHQEKFFIHKLVWFSKNPRWEEVMSLGDVALFLGDNHSISVIASDFAGCRPNSIYLCERVLSPDDCVYVCSYVSVLNDRTVFGLNDRTSTRLYPYAGPPPQLWITPKFV